MLTGAVHDRTACSLYLPCSVITGHAEITSALQASVFPLLAREEMDREAQALSTQLSAAGIFNMIDTTGGRAMSQEISCATIATPQK